MEEGISSASLLGKLGQVQYPRSRQGRRYPLPGLVALLILGALGGESSLRGMWMWDCKRWRKIACKPDHGLHLWQCPRLKL